MKTIWMSWIVWKSLGMLKDPQNTHWELLFKLLGIFSICRVGNSHIHPYIQLYYLILKILIFIYFETFDVSWTLLLFLTNFILFRTVPLVFHPLLYLSERIPLSVTALINVFLLKNCITECPFINKTWPFSSHLIIIKILL